MAHSIGVSPYRKNIRQIHSKLSQEIICKYCNRPYRIITHSKPTYVEGTRENLALVTYYYGCRRKDCSGPKTKLVAVKDPISSPRSTLTIEAKAKICKWRWKDHKTYQEIQRKLFKIYRIKRSLRGIELILKEYEESCSIFIPESAKQKILTNNRIILSIDGMKPLNGEDGIYAAFDLLTDTPLGCSLLTQQSEFCITEFLQGILKRLADAGINVPIVATISDALVGQRLSLEKCLTQAKICLCHYHFYELILKSARQADSAIITKTRSALRRFHYLMQYKLLKSQHQAFPWSQPIIHFIEYLFSLSNYRQRPQDHCFGSPEYLAKIRDLIKIGYNFLTENPDLPKRDIKVIEKFIQKFTPLLEEYSSSLIEIKHIRDKIKELQAILDAEESADIGEQKLSSLAKRWKSYLQKNRRKIGSEENTFLTEATKYLAKKAPNLMNYRRVEGAPTTNNRHEQRYHKIKYKLRRIIGHVAAKHFLKKHGNTILFVNPDATHEEIVEILTNAPIQEVRKRIRENRQPRNRLDQALYDQDKWDAEMAKFKEMCANYKNLKKGLT